MHLRAQLARVATGRAFLIQGGDCAESFAEFGSDKVRATFNLLLKMGAILRAGGCGEVVHLARIAGHFANPRPPSPDTPAGVTPPRYPGNPSHGPPPAQDT